jgi:hypothetical protein
VLRTEGQRRAWLKMALVEQLSGPKRTAAHITVRLPFVRNEMTKYRISAQLNLLVILLILILASGCVNEATTEIPVLTNTHSVLLATGTATNIPTETATKTPDYTSTPESASISPRTPVNSAVPTLVPSQVLYEIPVSTFVPEDVITQTPAPEAFCPSDVENPSGFQGLIDFLFPEERDKERGPHEQREELTERFLEVLNSGGIAPLYSALIEKTSPPYYETRYIDLTNDGVPELIFSDQNTYFPSGGGNIYVFGCVDGEYQVLLIETPLYEYAPEILAVQDLNMDGVNDLVIDQISCHYCYAMRVYEWDGEQFQSLVRKWIVIVEENGKIIDYWDFMEMGGYAQGLIEDVDSNGGYELIIEGEMPSYSHAIIGGDGPWREERLVYTWDGKYFVWYFSDYIAPPGFRFQAVQDGDIASEHGEFDKALSFYQDTIFSDQLSSWSSEAWYELVFDPEHTSISLPDLKKMPFNEIEYEQLAAYSRYRIMLLHILRGWVNEAETVYRTLQQETTPESVGYPYLEMANAFWEEYHLSSDIEQACEKAVKFASEHKEILEPLGSEDHGSWSRYYKPANVCPFTNADRVE